MNAAQTIPLAVRALMRNKIRSFLTMLGVIIGVASVISMVAVGEGAKARVDGVFASMGTNLLIVLSGSTTRGGLAGGFGSMPTLTWDDLTAIQRDAPAVKAAAPALVSRLTVVSEDANWTTNVSGTTPDFTTIRAWHVGRGAFFTTSDVDTRSNSVVLGQTVVDKLFGPGADPVGKTVRVRAIPFVVIGVLQRKGQSPMGQDYDDIAVVPHTTFQAKIQGSLGKYIPGIILVSAKSAADTGRAQSEIATLLRDRHHLRNANEDDFDVRNLTEIAQAQQAGTRALTGLLAAIAIVALVVGGIGIMNIMLVSVTERTKEIGLRMAVGAKPWHVLVQFLVEALTLSTAGGVIGVALGTGVARLVGHELGFPYQPRVDMVILAFAFSALVGVGFGIYPAKRASELDPIQALRAE